MSENQIKNQAASISLKDMSSWGTLMDSCWPYSVWLAPALAIAVVSLVPAWLIATGGTVLGSVCLIRGWRRKSSREDCKIYLA